MIDSEWPGLGQPAGRCQSDGATSTTREGAIIRVLWCFLAYFCESFNIVKTAIVLFFEYE